MIGINNNLNQTTNISSAKGYSDKTNNSLFERTKKASKTITDLSNSLTNMKADNAGDRLKGIVQFVASIMAGG